MLNTSLPTITNKQKQLLFFLYKFPFLHTYQFQKLCNHKSPSITKKWLKNLTTKKYLNCDIQTNVSPRKPAIYSLTKQARKLLKKENNCNVRVLDKVYRNKNVSEQFIYHNIHIADVYFFFRSHIEKDWTLHYLTKSDLIDYPYLKNITPDAYIAIKNDQEAKRYFLHLFDPHTPSFVYRQLMQTYIRYYDSNMWQENNEDKPFPKILIVCPDEKSKNKAIEKIQKLLKNEFIDRFEVYVTELKKILACDDNLWEKVE